MIRDTERSAEADENLGLCESTSAYFIIENVWDPLWKVSMWLPKMGT